MLSTIKTAQSVLHSEKIEFSNIRCHFLYISVEKSVKLCGQLQLILDDK